MFPCALPAAAELRRVQERDRRDYRPGRVADPAAVHPTESPQQKLNPTTAADGCCSDPDALEHLSRDEKPAEARTNSKARRSEPEFRSQHRLGREPHRRIAIARSR